MTLYFDGRLFLHAIYVGMVYSCLAFGATFYRKIADDLEVRKLNMGEEIYSAYNPLALLGISAFAILFFIFTFVALLRDRPALIIYVLPIACAINIIQFLIRAKHQRVMIKSRGVVIRYLFKEGGIGIGYANLRKIEARKFGFWYRVTFSNTSGIILAECHLRKTFLNHIKVMSRVNPECEVSIEL
ncbi:MAG: hypothetical protein JST20_11675 [Bacteroidetes bacterium]|nr:hypothetical protein [Bacteroidota bacterium]